MLTAVQIDHLAIAALWGHNSENDKHIRLKFSQSVCPQLTKGQLWMRAWFTKIVFGKVCVCVFVYM